MPVGQGWNSWGSVKEEVAYGTDPGGARQGYFRVVEGEGVDVDENFYQAPGLGGRNVRDMYPGRRVAGGPIPLETNYEGGWLYFLKHLLGGYVFTPNSPVATVNTHAFNCADTLPKGLAIELSKGDIPATQVFLNTGGKVNTGEFSLGQDQLLAFTPGMIFRDVAPGTARVATPTYPTDKHIKSVHYNPTYAAVVASVVGSNVATLQSFRITIDNKLERRFNLGRYTAEPVATEPREVTIEMVADFEDLTHLTKFLAATKGAFSIVLTGDIITGATRNSIAFLATSSILTAAPVNVASAGPITVPLRARAIGATPELSIQVINAQATL